VVSLRHRCVNISSRGAGNIEHYILRTGRDGAVGYERASGSLRDQIPAHTAASLTIAGQKAGEALDVSAAVYGTFAQGTFHTISSSSPHASDAHRQQTSPQAQKSFSTSYASSPISTPSRVLSYGVRTPASPFDTSVTSSVGMSSLPPTPTPILSAYRGKHSSSVGREAFVSPIVDSLCDLLADFLFFRFVTDAFDSSLLSRLTAEGSEEDG
jgi:hypothetical protein